MPFPDHDTFWRSTAVYLQHHTKPRDRCLAPDEFWWVVPSLVRYAEAPFLGALDFDWIVVHKGETHRLPQRLLRRFTERADAVFANEVFVIFAKSGAGLEILNDSDPHVRSLLERMSETTRRMPSDAGGDEPLTWFAPDTDVQQALRFLDDRIATGRGPVDTPSLSATAAPRQIDQTIAEGAPTLEPPSSRPGTVNRPIGAVHSFLEDVRARGFRPRGLVDVGANFGNWTRMALSIFPTMPFVLIEPQGELVAALAELTARHPGSHVVHAGAGRFSGEAVQTISEDPGASTFLPHPDDIAQRDGRQRPTPVTRLDELFKPNGLCGFPPDLVKVDVQGYEMEVLAGAETLFGRTELFVVETSLYEFMPGQPLARDVIAFMASRGYHIYDIPEYGRRPYDGAVGQIDFAFVRAAGMLRSSNAW